MPVDNGTPKNHTNIQDTSHSGAIPTNALDVNSNGKDGNIPESGTVFTTNVNGTFPHLSVTEPYLNVDDTQNVTGCTDEGTPASKSCSSTAGTHTITAEGVHINVSDHMSSCQPVVIPESDNFSVHTYHLTPESGKGNDTKQMSHSQPIVTLESDSVTRTTNQGTAESGKGNDTQQMSHSQPIDTPESDNISGHTEQGTPESDKVNHNNQAEGGDSTKSMQIPVIDIMDDFPMKGSGVPSNKHWKDPKKVPVKPTVRFQVKTNIEYGTNARSFKKAKPADPNFVTSIMRSGLFKQPITLMDDGSQLCKYIGEYLQLDPLSVQKTVVDYISDNPGASKTLVAKFDFMSVIVIYYYVL